MHYQKESPLMKYSLISAWLATALLFGQSATHLQASPAAWGIQAGQTTLFGGMKYALILTDIPGNNPYQLIGISRPTNSGGVWSASGDGGSQQQQPIVYTLLSFSVSLFVALQIFFSPPPSYQGQFTTTPPDPN